MGRRRAFRYARGTGARRRRVTQRSGAGLRRRQYQTRARTCPNPETPETTVRALCGISTSMFLRLWVRAPRIVIAVVGVESRGEVWFRVDDCLHDGHSLLSDRWAGNASFWASAIGSSYKASSERGGKAMTAGRRESRTAFAGGRVATASRRRANGWQSWQSSVASSSDSRRDLAMVWKQTVQIESKEPSRFGR